MKKVIQFIIDKKVSEIEELRTLVQPIADNFNIVSRDGVLNGYDAAGAVINRVIDWENHPEIPNSLEEILTEEFYIQ